MSSPGERSRHLIGFVRSNDAKACIFDGQNICVRGRIDTDRVASAASAASAAGTRRVVAIGSAAERGQTRDRRQDKPKFDAAHVSVFRLLHDALRFGRHTRALGVLSEIKVISSDERAWG